MIGSRRDFLSHVVRLAAPFARSAGLAELESAADGPSPSWLRPPGALPEAEFLESCTKCTACQEACPYQSIRRLGPEFGAAAGTPAIIPNESPCYLCEDMPCIAACEPQALRPTARHEAKMGRAVIDLQACYLAQGQPCDYCVVRCPLRSTAIEFAKNGLPAIHEESCAGCGVCEYLCPAQAVRTIPADRQLTRGSTRATDVPAGEATANDDRSPGAVGEHGLQLQAPFVAREINGDLQVEETRVF